MKLVALVGLCLVTRCGITAAGVNEVVEEGSDVILPCSLSTKENIQLELFDWKKDGPRDEREVFLYDAGIHYNDGRPGQSETFKGRVSHFPDQLKYGNASITIRNTKMTDSGNYTCHFPRLQPPQIFRVELVVDCDLKDRSGENIPGAAPKPYVTSLDQTKDWSRLQCEVRDASPKPHVQWQDSDGNNLTAEKPQVAKSGDRYDVILQVTVTKTGRYRCVATQETICHQIYAEIYVFIGEFPTGWIVFTFFITLLVVGVLLAVLLAVLVYKRRITLNFNKDEEKRRNSPDANSGASLPLKSTTTTSQQHADNRREEVSFNDD